MSDIVDNASPEEFAEMFIESVRESYQEWLELQRRRDPGFLRLPDYEAAIDRAERDLKSIAELKARIKSLEEKQ